MKVSIVPVIFDAEQWLGQKEIFGMFIDKDGRVEDINDTLAYGDWIIKGEKIQGS